jgi:two-component sensor histidine kinase/PAS domain-containing protein
MELEKEITTNENLSALIINNAFDAIILYTPVKDGNGDIVDFVFSYMNDSAFRILEGTREDYIGNSFTSSFPFSLHNGMFEDFRQTALTGIPNEETYYYEDEFYRGWFRNSIIKAGEGIIVYFRDVTETKEMEISLNQKTIELENSLTLLSKVIESIKDPFLVVDSNFSVVFANAAMEFWFQGNGPFSGKLLWDLLPKIMNSRIEKHLKTYMKNQAYNSFTTTGFYSDRHYHVSVYPYQKGLTIYAQDITDKLRTEQQLKKSLKEKEVLLKEIHHRVKNNLQIIASMMNLQCSFVKDPHYTELLSESRNRISIMAIIHQRLYEENSYASINFRSFAGQIIKSLFDLYSESSRKVTLELSIDDIDLGLDHAINISLILNELITNVLKYAFPGIRAGKLKVFIKNEREFTEIIVDDNGVGFPGEIDFRNTESLGLLIVNSLVDQLDGTIKLDRSNGTRFTIKLKKEKKNQLNLL